MGDMLQLLAEFLSSKGGGKGPDRFAKKPPVSKFAAQSEAHAQAIARVKSIQRREGGKELWEQYIEGLGRVKLDPAAHGIETLEGFLVQGDPSGDTIGAEYHFDEGQLLIQKVRLGQKYSEEFKEAGIKHVMSFGKDVRDPARH